MQIYFGQLESYLSFEWYEKADQLGDELYPENMEKRIKFKAEFVDICFAHSNHKKGKQLIKQLKSYPETAQILTESERRNIKFSKQDFEYLVEYQKDNPPKKEELDLEEEII